MTRKYNCRQTPKKQNKQANKQTNKPIPPLNCFTWLTKWGAVCINHGYRSVNTTFLRRRLSLVSFKIKVKLTVSAGSQTASEWSHPSEIGTKTWASLLLLLQLQLLLRLCPLIGFASASSVLQRCVQGRLGIQSYCSSCGPLRRCENETIENCLKNIKRLSHLSSSAYNELTIEKKLQNIK